MAEVNALRGFMISGKPTFDGAIAAAQQRRTADVAILLHAQMPQTVRVAKIMIAQAAQIDRAVERKAALVRAGHVAQARARFFSRGSAQMEIRNGVARIVAENQHLLEDSTRIIAQAMLLGRFGIAVTILLALAISVVTYRTIKRLVVERLSRVRDALTIGLMADIRAVEHALERLAKGAIGAPITLGSQPLSDRRKDEIGDVAAAYNATLTSLERMGDAFERTRDHLSFAMGQIVDAARSVHSCSLEAQERNQAVRDEILAMHERTQHSVGEFESQSREAEIGRQSSAELANAIEQIARATESQSRKVSAGIESMERLRSFVEQIAASAAILAQEAQSNVTVASEGLAAVAGGLDMASSLRSSAQASHQEMTSLLSRSREVEDVIATIEEIADQTNLLALNAAIEAARAGEFGRGFAVVADEVRKLAMKSAQSTSRIAGSLSGIRNAIDAASTMMERSMQLAERVSASMVQANDAFGVILSAIERSAELARTVSERTKETEVFGNTTTVALREINDLAQDDAAAAEEISCTAAQVRQLVEGIAAANRSLLEDARRSLFSIEALNEHSSGSESAASSLGGYVGDLREVVAFFDIGKELDALPSPAPPLMQSA